MGTELQKYQERMASSADKYADEEASASSFITTRGGILSLGDDEFPGNQMLVVVVDAVHENTYYEDAFDPDVMMPPTCYAYGRKASEMEPHKSMFDHDFFEEQNADCESCPMNEWGSADRGEGKACSNRRRLAVIPAGYFTKGKKRGEYDMYEVEDPEHYETADIAFLKLPVTSTKNWSKYVKMLRSKFNRPPYGVLTHVYIEPDPKTQYKLHFDCVGEVEDDLLGAVIARHEEATELIEEPYAPPSDEESEKPKAKAKAGLKKRRQSRRSGRDED